MRRGLPADLALIERHRAPLVLLAAGLGSRYGGVKPVAPVGPDGEALIVMAARQAAEAGFDEIIVVVGPSTETEVSAALKAEEVALALQVVPPGRTRPLGTVDALLTALEPFGSLPPLGVAVANGDDLYGVDALRMARTWVDTAEGTNGSDGAAVMFEVAHTMSPAGGVSRAVPVVHNGRIIELEEQRDVHVEAGTIVTGAGAVLSPTTPVSMNLWCLRRSAIRWLREDAAEFIRAHMTDGSAEFGLPSGVDGLLRRGLTFDVLLTDSVWHGVTWPEDVARVRAALTAERDAGLHG